MAAHLTVPESTLNRPRPGCVWPGRRNRRCGDGRSRHQHQTSATPRYGHGGYIRKDGVARAIHVCQSSLQHVKRNLFICDSVNSLVIRRPFVAHLVQHSQVQKLSFPPGGLLWRGGGFRNVHRKFFDGNLHGKIRVSGAHPVANARSTSNSTILSTTRRSPDFSPAATRAPSRSTFASELLVRM